MGIGLADFTTRTCAEKIDPSTMYTNAITAHALRSAAIPIVAENDRQALQAALATLRHGTQEEPRIVRIKNTKELETIWVSETCRDFIDTRDNLQIIGDAVAFRFSEDGSLNFGEPT